MTCLKLDWCLSLVSRCFLFRLELLWEGETDGDWMRLAPHQPSKAQTGLVCSFLRFVAAGGVAWVEVLSTCVRRMVMEKMGWGRTWAI